MANDERIPFKTVGLRLPLDLLDMVEREARRLDLEPADWYRGIVHRGLTSARMTKTDAAKYRRPKTRKGQREFARQGWKRDRTPVS